VLGNLWFEIIIRKVLNYGNFPGGFMFKRVLIVTLVLAFSGLAHAVNCERIQSKISRIEGRQSSGKPFRAGKLQRLKDKYQALCVNKISKQEWKSQRQANRGQYRSANKCGRLASRLARAQQSGKQVRIDRILGKMQQHGCPQGGAAGGFEAPAVEAYEAPAGVEADF
jgi:hypothetical protein